jgi:hypothetical protein
MSEVLYRGPRVGDHVWLFRPGCPDPIHATVLGFSSEAVDLRAERIGLTLDLCGVPQRGMTDDPKVGVWDWPGTLETAEVMPPEPPPDMAPEPGGAEER